MHNLMHNFLRLAGISKFFSIEQLYDARALLDNASS